MIYRRLVNELKSSLHGGRAILLLPLALIVLITWVHILAPSRVQISPLLVAAPAITAAFAGPALTALIGLCALAAQVYIGWAVEGLTNSNFQAQTAALLAVSVFVVVFSGVRERRTAELHQARYVAEALQEVILHPLPPEIGPLRIASVYLAAEEEAQIGGDLYAATRTAEGATRLLIGDVRGKGIAAVGDAALLLGTFRATARHPRELAELAGYLDVSVSWELAEPLLTEHSGETFITAALIDVPDGSETLQIVDCGHPPPLVLRQNQIVPLEATEPAPPLGLGQMAPRSYRMESWPFRVGELALFYTDGVVEARNLEGEFFPLAERMTEHAGSPPEILLDQLRSDLLEHVGGALSDDAVMIAVERTALVGEGRG
ncbi:PP2C family protein-serine/threonine phosphatase [Streptomyces sp. TP-A0874]|uniref:PP2C family protein-serine/threonine phosphatase n=1 Tax=Streptomyces sp. TP-A0874 TaxID=549819 RepID=UPI000B0DCAD8|nr:PP2C family protein-serine/threonine phosphatase [Streptomyces sp. TP-A0874]